MDQVAAHRPLRNRQYKARNTWTMVGSALVIVR